MNFSQFDMVLLFTMTLAVVLMSFTFPALGLTDSSDEVNETDIPDLNLSSSSWDIVDEFPDHPATPTSGTLKRDDSVQVIGEHQTWISNITDQDNGTSIEIASFGTGNHTINVGDFTDGNATVDIYNITHEGQEIRHANNSWSIIFNVERYENVGTANATSEVEWEIIESPDADEGGGLTGIPVIGGLFNAGEQLFLALAYLGDILLWGFGFLVEVSLTVVETLLTAMVYAVEMLAWLSTTYASIVSSAPSGFASAVLAVPGALMTFEFLKITFLGIKMLPST